MSVQDGLANHSFMFLKSCSGHLKFWHGRFQRQLWCNWTVHSNGIGCFSCYTQCIAPLTMNFHVKSMIDNHFSQCLFVPGIKLQIVKFEDLWPLDPNETSTQILPCGQLLCIMDNLKIWFHFLTEFRQRNAFELPTIWRPMATETRPVRNRQTAVGKNWQIWHACFRVVFCSE
jgi:hypothetical protein